MESGVRNDIQLMSLRVRCQGTEARSCRRNSEIGSRVSGMGYTEVSCTLQLGDSQVQTGGSKARFISLAVTICLARRALKHFLKPTQRRFLVMNPDMTNDTVDIKSWQYVAVNAQHTQHFTVSVTPQIIK